MLNPLRGVYLDGDWYNYAWDSFRESVDLKNTSSNSQNSRAFTINGANPSTFTISLVLENTYNVYNGSVSLGSTTYIGVSRLVHLKSTLSAVGASMPILFVNPYGVTSSVVPTGGLDIEPFIAKKPQSAGMEFRVTLTLEATI